MKSDRLANEDSPLLDIRSLRKSYLVGRWPGKKAQKLVLKDINLRIERGSTLALAGRSGSGKSTLARCIALLDKADSGSVSFCGIDILNAQREEQVSLRRKIQLVFQHSALAINPRLSICQAVAEPLLIQKGVSPAEARQRALFLLEQVRIEAGSVDRTIQQFSGGQRQRIALARALTLNPHLLILDECLAGLDVSTQISITDLLRDLQVRYGLSYLFITHDLRMAAYLADTIAILSAGQIVETAPTRELFSNPKRPETCELIDSIPPFPPRLGSVSAV